MQITTSLINNNESSEVIKLTQGDTKPYLVVSLIDETINTSNGVSSFSPLDVSDATVKFKIRSFGSNELIDSVNCTLLPGLENPDGTINFDPPYDLPGSGGRIMVVWTSQSLSVAGNLESEIEVTYNSDQSVQTAFNLIKLFVRPQY